MNTTYPETERKYFTVEEANQTLPLVRVIIRDITQLYADIRERRDRLSAVSGKDEYGDLSEMETSYSEELEDVESTIYVDIEKLKSYITELTDLGIELKDPETGLIDFYSLQEGREIYLCWKHGEETVSHWHELDAGFDGRQAL